MKRGDIFMQPSECDSLFFLGVVNDVTTGFNDERIVQAVLLTYNKRVGKLSSLTTDAYISERECVPLVQAAEERVTERPREPASSGSSLPEADGGAWGEYQHIKERS